MADRILTNLTALTKEQQEISKRIIEIIHTDKPSGYIYLGENVSEWKEIP